MPGTVAEQLIESHLVEGEMEPGEEIGLRIDQTLTQDATGTMVMLELEAMALDRVRTELSAQYVDHNLIQEDYKNPDDHLFLKSASERFGLWYSRPGNGVSHPVHMERFGVPGKSMVGSDSHTPAAGSLGMLAIGAGGLEVALAMAGEPFYVKSPEIWGVRLEGELPDWCSAKDVILEMLRRHDVDGGVGRIVEYHGPGLDTLTAMDRHVIANMGTELGATTTVFPSDGEVRRFLEGQGRGDAFVPLEADDDAEYHVEETLDLSEIEPLIALPTSPGNVKAVADVQGKEVHQAYLGSSANPGLRDFAVPAMIVDGQMASDRTSFDVNPTSRQILENLVEAGYLAKLIHAGARIHQAGCNGCIGMGQAPATDTISLRTVPRNFPGRSGTKEDQVHLVSPETATAAALTGEITDPRDLEDRFGISYPAWTEPDAYLVNTKMLVPPPDDAGPSHALRKGPNITTLPDFDPLPDRIEAPVLLKMGDDISTDEISPAGTEVLPFRSNLEELSKFTFSPVDGTFYDRATAARDAGTGGIVVGGTNYGQGSSREHAALSPRYLGVRAVLATSYARIHWQNLANFGILPLEFSDEADHDAVEQGDTLVLDDLHEQFPTGKVTVENATQDTSFQAFHTLSERQVEMVRTGSLINLVRERAGSG